MNVDKSKVKTIIALIGVLFLAYAIKNPVFVRGASPQHGSYMARFYAPYYYDYIEIDDGFADKTVNSATENVTIQGHVYVQDVSCTGVEEVFDIFQFYYYYSPNTFFSYGASVKVSNTVYDDELKLYISTAWRPYQPDYVYIRTLNKNTWYNITLVHNDTILEVYVNDVLNATETGIPDFDITLNHLQIGESNNQHRELIFAYNMYVDYVRLEGGGLGSALEWDFESDFADFETQYVSTGSTLEIVDATETGTLGAPPSVNFSIDPESQSGYVYETLTYDLTCYNDGTESQFTLEIVVQDDDGDAWSWSFSESSFTLDEDEEKTVSLYCIVGSVGNWSRVTVHFRRVGTSVYSVDTAQTVSLGEDPGTVSPIGLIPSITAGNVLYYLCGLFSSLGVASVGFGAFGRGKDPMSGVIFFGVGLAIFSYIIEWLPTWVVWIYFGILALAYANKWAGGLTG